MRLNSIQLDKHHLALDFLCFQDAKRASPSGPSCLLRDISWQCGIAEHQFPSGPPAVSRAGTNIVPGGFPWLPGYGTLGESVRTGQEHMVSTTASSPARPPNSPQRPQAGSLHTFGWVGSKIFYELLTFKIQGMPHKNPNFQLLLETTKMWQRWAHTPFCVIINRQRDSRSL